MDESLPPRKIPIGLRLRRMGRLLWLLTEYLFDALVDALAEYARIIWREGALFIGLALSLIGFFNFQNGKNCDGNTNDYLSCTRPSTFYYYGWLEIVFIVIGVFLILLWYLKLRERALQHAATEDR